MLSHIGVRDKRKNYIKIKILCIFLNAEYYIEKSESRGVETHSIILNVNILFIPKPNFNIILLYQL